MDQKTRAIRFAYRNHFTPFMDLAIRLLNPTGRCRHHWMLEVLGDALGRCARRECRGLILNLPPRNLKSFTASIALPAFYLAHHPHENVLCVAGDRGLVDAQHTLARRLMTHGQYRALFPHVKITEKGKTLSLDHGGSRTGVTSSAAIMGRGADMIIIDDPLPAAAMHDGRLCDAVNLWYDGNIRQRLNDKENGVIIVVMQRLHVNDLTAHLLAQGGWELLSLPAIAEDDWRYPPVFGDQVMRHKGDALQPAMESRDQLRAAMLAMGAKTFMAQYQQRPYPRGQGEGKHGWYTPYRNGQSFVPELVDIDSIACGTRHVSEEAILLHTIFGEGEHPWPPDMRRLNAEEAEAMLALVHADYLRLRSTRGQDPELAPTYDEVEGPDNADAPVASDSAPPKL